MPNAFAQLQQLSARRAARAFAPGVSGGGRMAWFPATAEAEPVAREDYPLLVRDVTGGQARRGGGENLQTLLRSTDTLTILLPDLLPYDPSRGKTTVLIGTGKEQALRYRISEYRRAAGIMELDCERIAPLPPGPS